MSALAEYYSAVGRKPAMVMWYQAFTEPLYYPDQFANMRTFGGVPMVTWGPTEPLADIAAGSRDDYIMQSAALARAWDAPMFIRPAQEMNIGGTPWGVGVNGNTPKSFIAFWRHLVDMFRCADVRNVVWVWSPNVFANGKAPFEPFYPGDDYVDWMGLDGYNYSVVDKVPWMSLDTVFQPSYDRMVVLNNKPMMIAETASTELGGDKATWIREGLLCAVPDKMPRFKLVVWFDRTKETDWRVNSSPESLAAWKEVVNSPLYQGSVLRPPRRREAIG